MYYEVYIDILFLVNAIMDYILLQIVRRMIKCTTTNFRILLGSMIGAVGMCMLVVLPINSPLVQALIGHLLINTCMIKVGCNTKGRKKLIIGILALYAASFLAGGIFQSFSYYTGIDNWLNRVFLSDTTQSVRFRTFFILSIVSYIVIISGIKIYERMKNKIGNTYDVTLYEKGRKKCITGFRDTGNHLKDSLSGRPVSIIDTNSLKGLLDNDLLMQIEDMSQYRLKEETNRIQSNLHYIPYHSIGNTSGILPGLTIDMLSIKVGDRIEKVVSPVIAVYEEPVSINNEYQMILNPMLIDY